MMVSQGYLMPMVCFPHWNNTHDTEVLYDAHVLTLPTDACYLRQRYRIVGTLIGCLPGHVQQVHPHLAFVIFMS